MLYLFDDMESFTDEALEAALPHLPQQRRERVLGYKPMLSRKLSALAWLLLEQALREHGVETVPEMAFGESGKPYFPSMPELHFSLSHCPRAVACAVGERPVGVDVESIRPYRPQLGRYVLNESELAQVEGGDCDREFVRLWTRKEALVKMRGTGLRDNLRGLLDEASDVLFRTEEHEGYICTVCSQRNFLIGNTIKYQHLRY